MLMPIGINIIGINIIVGSGCFSFPRDEQMQVSIERVCVRVVL
jgi:hypothetical protein